MYKIKTSELLSEKGIVEELTSIEVVKNIYDDLFETKHHYLMAAYSLEYKIGNIELFFEEHKVDS